MTDHFPTYHLDDSFREKLKKLTESFTADGFKIFELEFSRIDKFVETACQDSDDRDDRSIRRTPKTKYLLEAVSFFIYDDLNRYAFNQTKKTLIIMPDCLTLHNPECEKVETTYGDVCKRCVTSCQAYEITELARKHKAKVIFSKRKLTEQLEHFQERADGSLGVIGVACLLMLATGMRKASEIDIPTRGVPLSFTGCEHWNDKPFASRFPLDWLRMILEEKEAANGS